MGCANSSPKKGKPKVQKKTQKPPPAKPATTTTTASKAGTTTTATTAKGQANGRSPLPAIETTKVQSSYEATSPSPSPSRRGVAFSGRGEFTDVNNSFDREMSFDPEMHNSATASLEHMPPRVVEKRPTPRHTRLKKQRSEAEALIASGSTEAPMSSSEFLGFYRVAHANNWSLDKQIDSTEEEGLNGKTDNTATTVADGSPLKELPSA